MHQTFLYVDAQLVKCTRWSLSLSFYFCFFIKVQVGGLHGLSTQALGFVHLPTWKCQLTSLLWLYNKHDHISSDFTFFFSKLILVTLALLTLYTVLIISFYIFINNPIWIFIGIIFNFYVNLGRNGIFMPLHLQSINMV